MVCESSTTEKKKGTSCCSSKKGTSPAADKSAIAQDREIMPIIKREIKQETTGCKCCVKRVDPDPSAGLVLDFEPCSDCRR